MLPASASAYVERPDIGEAAAFDRTQRYLASSYPGWRTRLYGYIDCRNGRINSYTWSCRVGWIRGYNCRVGKIRITNSYAEEGTVYYNVAFRWRYC